MQTVLSESSTEEFNSAVLAITRVEGRVVGPGIVDVTGSVGKDDDEDEDEDADEDADEDEDILQSCSGVYYWRVRVNQEVKTYA